MTVKQTPQRHVVVPFRRPRPKEDGEQGQLRAFSTASGPSSPAVAASSPRVHVASWKRRGAAAAVALSAKTRALTGGWEQVVKTAQRVPQSVAREVRHRVSSATNGGGGRSSSSSHQQHGVSGPAGFPFTAAPRSVGLGGLRLGGH
jgi:hypothetical protein